jgi:hypothetical protein
MTDSKLDLLQGTLDLMVLQTLDTMGASHCYGIARRIEQLSRDHVVGLSNASPGLSRFALICWHTQASRSSFSWWP